MEMVRTGRLGSPLTPDNFGDYFNRYYGRDNTSFDEQGITGLLQVARSAFRTAADRFRLIDDDGETVIVPYLPAGLPESPIQTWVGALSSDSKAGWARRKLQRYTVTVPKKELERLVRIGDVEEKAGLWVALAGRYDSILGLLPADDHGPGGGFHS